MNCNHCGNTFDDGDFAIGMCADCLGVPARISEDELDRLIERSSVPNLARLYKRAKGEGLITPAQAYA